MTGYLYQKKFAPFAATVFAMALWGSAFIAMKLALVNTEIAPAMFFRLALASLMMTPFVLLRQQVLPKRSDVILLVILGFLEPVLYFILESLALQRTTASQGGLVFSLLPIVILALSQAFGVHKPQLRTWIGGIFGVVSIILISTSSSEGSYATAPNPALGNFFEFLAILCAAFFIVLAGSILDRISPELLALGQCVFGSVSFGLFAVFNGSDLTIARESIWPIAYLGFFVTGGAYVAFNYGIKHLKAPTIAPLYALVPGFTMAFSFLWSGGTLPMQFLVAFVLISFAVCLSR